MDPLYIGIVLVILCLLSSSSGGALGGYFFYTEEAKKVKAEELKKKFIASGSIKLKGEPDILSNGEQLSGTTFGPINFPCPVRYNSSTVRYGAKGNYFKRNLPEGTNSFNLTDVSIGGDPAPGENKQWFVKYQCV